MRLASTFLIILTIAGQAFSAEERILNIYNWSDYIDPAIIEEFESEYGIKINYDIYDSAEMVDTKLLTGGSGYDIVTHASTNSELLVPIGVYQPVDRSRLQNWDNLDPSILSALKEASGRETIGVPYMWGTTGFSYNVDMIRQRMPNAPVESADLVFDPEVVKHFADCGVTLLEGASSVIPFVMIYLGHPNDSVDPTHLAEVEETLSSIRPYIKYYSSGKMLLDLPSKEVCIAMSWSGDYSVASSRAKEAGVEINLAYSVPIEGSTSWYDIMFIPTDAPHPNNAHLFLDFMLRPDVIARASNYTGYANANRKATALVDPSIRNDTAIYPDQTIKDRLQVAPTLEPKLERLRSRVWTKVKSGL
ncbi:MAG: extracellular solute-binding protein [Halioglobus sp.]